MSGPLAWDSLTAEATEAIVDRHTLVLDLEQARLELAEARERNHELRKAQAEASKAHATALEDSERIIALKASQLAYLSEDNATMTMQFADKEAEFQAQLADLKQSTATTISELELTVADLNAELGALHAYKEQKEKVDLEVSSLRATVQANQREYDARLHEMRVGMIDDKEKWEREIVDLEERTRAEMTASMQQQLDATTKRAIIENGQMADELLYQSQSCQRIEAESVALKDLNQQLRRENSLSAQALQQMAGKVRYLEQVVSKLRAGAAAGAPGRLAAAPAVAAAARELHARGGGAPEALPSQLLQPLRPPPNCECIVCDLCEAQRSQVSSLLLSSQVSAEGPGSLSRERPQTHHHRARPQRPKTTSAAAAAATTSPARRAKLKSRQQETDDSEFLQWVTAPRAQGDSPFASADAYAPQERHDLLSLLG